MERMLVQINSIPGAGSPDAPPAKLFELNIVFGNVVSVLIGFGAIALFVMLVYGGFLYITAGGDQKKAEGARNTITYAFLGMVLVAVAFLVIEAIAVFTGVMSIKTFSVFQ